MGNRMRNDLTLPRIGRAGATAIEYALIAAFISILIVSGATVIGTDVSNFFTNVANGF